MKKRYILTKKAQEHLLKEFCEVNDYSYYMVFKVMFENLFGEEASKDFKRIFTYFISGRLGINHEFIKFEE